MNDKYMLISVCDREILTEKFSDYEARLRYAKENTSLPEKPNMKRIEEFVVSVNEKSVVVFLRKGLQDGN